MTSPRELDCTNTHTHLTGNRMNPWAILGSVQHHPSSTPQAPSLPKITWCGHDRATHPSGSEGSLGGFLYTPVSGSIHPRVLLLHPHCTFLPRALHTLHSRMIYAVFFWQYNGSNPSETGWNQSCLLHHSLQAQAGEANGQHVLTNSFPAPRAALPTWTAQQGALGFAEPNIGMRELPFISLNSLIFVCLQLPLVRNQELPLFMVISAERSGPDQPWGLTSLCFQRCQDKLQLREGIVTMGS